MSPEHFCWKNLPSSYSEKMRWVRVWIFLTYLISHTRFYSMISFHPVYIWFSFQRNRNSISFFLHSSPTDPLYVERVNVCSSVARSNQAHANIHANVFSSLHRILMQMYSVVSVGHSYMQNPTELSQATPSKQHFPKFHYRTSSFCCIPFFFALEFSKDPPKDK